MLQLFIQPPEQDLPQPLEHSCLQPLPQQVEHVCVHPEQPSQEPEHDVVQPVQDDEQLPHPVLQDAEQVSLQVLEHVFAQPVEQLDAQPAEHVVHVAWTSIGHDSLASANAATDATTATASAPRLIFLIRGSFLFSSMISLFSICSMFALLIIHFLFLNKERQKNRQKLLFCLCLSNDLLLYYNVLKVYLPKPLLFTNIFLYEFNLLFGTLIVMFFIVIFPVELL